MVDLVDSMLSSISVLSVAIFVCLSSYSFCSFLEKIGLKEKLLLFFGLSQILKRHIKGNAIHPRGEF